MQTAVSWLEQEFIKLESTIGVHGKMYELIEQAKEIEKQQIIDAAERWKGTDFAKKYYAETYGSKGSDVMTPENHIGVLSEAVRKETTSSQIEISDEQIEKVFTKEDMWEIFVRGMGAVKHEEVGTISGKEIFDNYINYIAKK